MRTLIIAPNHVAGVNYARRKKLPRDTRIATRTANLHGLTMADYRVLFLTWGWGHRFPGNRDAAIEMEKTAMSRGAIIEWVSD